MRLKRYISEAIVVPKATEVNTILNVVRDARNAWYKEQTARALHTAMEKAGKEASKKFKDVNIEFEKTQNWQEDLTGGVRPWFPHYLVFRYHTKETQEEWLDKTSFKIWLERFRSVIEHELVHIEQFRKIAKAVGVDKASDILLDLVHKQQYTSKDDLDKYLTSHLEIMAHAKQTDAELEHEYLASEILQMLRNKYSLEYIAFGTPGFQNYVSIIKKNFPRTWKKFIKYLVSFLERRQKKEEKSGRKIERDEDIEADVEMWKNLGKGK